MDKQNLTLSELVNTMCDEVMLRAGYAKEDTLRDVADICKDYEDCIEAVGKEYISMKYIWCIRREGTLMTTDTQKMLQWSKTYENEKGKSYYEIECNGGKFSIREVEGK